MILAKSLILTVTLSSGLLIAQSSADPSKPPTDAWPTYHGDYRALHYSPLRQIDTANARNLSLAWTYKSNGSAQNAMLGGEGHVWWGSV